MTHGGIDRALDLPSGSTSYYFRTRRALLDAAVRRLTEQSRLAFDDVAGSDPADAIGRYLHHLVTDRSTDVRARFALASDAAHDPELAAALSRCLFSADGAAALFAGLGSSSPHDDAADLLVFCEGVAAAHLFGAAPEHDDLIDSVRRRFGL
ncbi:hypothetical protein nbrc107696_30480 [Gordonia spumicola]|uniref:Tetracyclin repressor-like C-terminal group 31 domain-containing protein n=1 Tax=Gordonia spumicola TaxID=589161 RepID=A0A7I9VBL7_9ACTN|nr:TetR family transcriptional regulator [Gordonia spumicola]GEE02602.1 hypothetical protein nbrc107696_30480 [Gordonia spumicola]